MLDFQATEIWEPAVYDTFERTSSRDLKPVQEMLYRSFDSTFRSEFLTMLLSFDRLSRTLTHLESVPDDWNTYGSPAPSARSIKVARSIFNTLRSEHLLPKRVLPSADGGVAFVFSSTTENRAAIETLNSEESFVLLYDRKGNSRTLDWAESGSKQDEMLNTLRDHLRGASLAAS
jgi:hypothetical protein